jgi:hypothetical protein
MIDRERIVVWNMPYLRLLVKVSSFVTAAALAGVSVQE